MSGTLNGVAQSERVLGQGAGLVRAQDVDTSEFLDRNQFADNGLLLGQQPGADGHRHRQHRRHRHRDRGDREDQGELQGGHKWVAAQQRHEHDHRDEQCREDDEVVADLQDGLLEVADRVRALHQFRGLAEVGVGAGGVDQGTDLTAADHRPGEHRIPGRAGRRQRLPGQRGLVDLDLVAVQQPGVGRDDVPQPQPDHIPGHQFPCRRGNPVTVASDPGVDRELGLQRVDRVAGLPFLAVADDTVGQQQQQDDEEVGPVPDRAGQDHRDLDHPRDRAPEVGQELQQRVRLVLGDLVRAVRRQPFRRLDLG